MLTLKQFEKLKEGEFKFGSEFVEDYWNAAGKMLVDFVAVKGGGNDWAVYYALSVSKYPLYYIMSNGDKMTNPESIKKCVPCTDEVLKLYRR
jgi:hypothetical protein